MSFGKSMVMAAAAAQMLSMERADKIQYNTNTKRWTERGRELSRKQIRNADRSQKQYLLKGVRP